MENMLPPAIQIGSVQIMNALSGVVDLMHIKILGLRLELTVQEEVG
jgi:hypothetical protein